MNDSGAPSGPASRRLWPWAALVVLVLLTLYAISPLLTEALAPRLAAALGVDELSLRLSHPGLTGLTVRELRAVKGRVALTVARGEITYGWRGLLAGRLDAVVLERVHVDIAAPEAAPAPRGQTMPAADPPLPAELFAFLPADKLKISELTLTVPGLDFTAAGRLEITPAQVHLVLFGHTPAEADPFQLDARFSRTGELQLQLRDRQQPGAPLLNLSSTLGSDSLAVNGEFDLHGFAFDLAAALAGARPGSGAVSGQFAGALLWPLPSDLDAASIHHVVPRATGTLQARWQPAAGGASWKVADVDVAWNLEAGMISGTGVGLLHYDNQAVQLSAGVERFLLSTGEGRGGLAVAATGAEMADAEAEFLRLAWTLAPAALSVDGSFDISAPLLQSARSLVDLPAGEGTVSGTFETLIPRPLTTELDPLGLKVRGSLQGAWQGEPDGIDLPEFAGNWQWRERFLSGDFDVRAGYAGMQTSLGLTLDNLGFADGDTQAAGTLRLGTTGRAPFRLRRSQEGRTVLSAQADLNIKRPLAGSLISGWKQPYDLTSGTVRLTADLQWADDAANGAITAGLQRVSAYYEDYAASGVTGELRFSADDGAWSLAPALLTATAVDTGVPLTDIRSTVAWRGDSVSVTDSAVELLGGRARAAPFEYRLRDGSADILVELEGLALPRILALAGDSVSGTGTVDGMVPVALRNNRPSVTDGQARSRPPGGLIRVSPGLAGAAGQPGLDFALRALQEFRYSALEADVAYTADGDLDLAVQLRGSNPDIEAGRPIHYNLNISQNLPTLLRSLRLQEEITRGVDRRIRN